MRPSVSLSTWSLVAGIAVILVSAISFILAGQVSREKDRTLERFKSEAAERTRNLELEIEKHKERAAKAETEVITLKERLQPRALSPEQTKRLTEAMTQFAGQTMSLLVDARSTEAANLMGQIRAALDRAGWRLNGNVGSGSSGGGVEIYSEHESKAATALLETLQSLGLSAKRSLVRRTWLGFPSGSIEIFVGEKP